MTTPVFVRKGATIHLIRQLWPTVRQRVQLRPTSSSHTSLPQFGRAIRVHRVGGAENLVDGSAAVDPAPPPGTLLVRNLYAGVNFHDTYTRRGIYPRTLPFVCGCEGGGVVVGGDPGLIGKRVVYFSYDHGSYAEFTLVPAHRVVEVPDAVSLDVATAALVQGLTAHYLTTSTFALGAGHTALVHAAAGGTGRLVCQLARLRGATTIATVGSEDKVAHVRAHADHVVILTDGDGRPRDPAALAAEVRALSPGGCNVVYDGVGRDTVALSLACTRPRGTVVLFGNASGVPADLPVLTLAASGSLFVTRPVLEHYMLTRGELDARCADLWSWIVSGAIDVPIHARFTLADAAAAHRMLESRGARGKILLTCTELAEVGHPELELAPAEPCLRPFVTRRDVCGVTTITLNRPEELNSLSDGMLKALRDLLVHIASDSTVLVVVLAGEGRAFCAGHNLKEMSDKRKSDPVHAEALFRECSKLMRQIRDLPQPVIACVHGVATAAGCQLVATCDLAVASKSARFATSGINLGLFCSAPGVALGRTVSKKHAMEMLLTGDFIDATRAAQMGLINTVVDDHNLASEVGYLANKIAAKSPTAVTAGKRGFHRQMSMADLSEAYEFSGAEMAAGFMKPDAERLIGAFLSKTNP